MARDPSHIAQTDLTRTLRACKTAGIMSKVIIRVEGGSIIIQPLDPSSEPPKAPQNDDDGSSIIL